MTSVAVVCGGLLMYYFHLFWVDPVVSLLIALSLIRASIALLKESTSILMQFTPAEIELENVVHSITSLPEIKNIHHIHLWKLDDHRINLEAHLDFNDNITLEASGKVIDRLDEKLHREFGINHATFQCEYNRDDDKSIVVQ
jgi:cobalt-zinc-cadmium efflux system protein